MKSALKPLGIIVGIALIAGCSTRGPKYDTTPLNEALISKGLVVQIQEDAASQFKALPIVMNAPPVQFNLVTVDPNFAARFNFEEDSTGYVFNQFFTQQALVKQFVDNTNLALQTMRIPVTGGDARYHLDARIESLSFNVATPDKKTAKMGYKPYVLGQMVTAYQLSDNATHQTIWQREYHSTIQQELPTPSQTINQSALQLSAP
ncbi:MAG: hypothetical protein EBX40_03960 [Gammaproteobacteria bacterium]|nr:hypothetical protein [Gammaproteobacteria bacterium]